VFSMGLRMMNLQCRRLGNGSIMTLETGDRWSRSRQSRW
jgi:hypothetical protein